MHLDSLPLSQIQASVLRSMPRPFRALLKLKNEKDPDHASQDLMDMARWLHEILAKSIPRFLHNEK